MPLGNYAGMSVYRELSLPFFLGQEGTVTSHLDVRSETQWIHPSLPSVTRESEGGRGEGVKAIKMSRLVAVHMCTGNGMFRGLKWTSRERGVTVACSYLA